MAAWALVLVPCKPRPNSLIDTAKAMAAVKASPAPPSTRIRRPASETTWNAWKKVSKRIPFGDKTGLRRHRRQTHHRDQRADAEPGTVDESRPRCTSRSSPVASFTPSAVRNSAPLASVWPARWMRAATQASPARSPVAVLRENQRRAEQGDGHRAILRRGKRQQAPPISPAETRRAR